MLELALVVACCLSYCAAPAEAFSLHIHIASAWANFDRRQALRQAFQGGCVEIADHAGHEIEWHFFMGSPPTALKLAAVQESSTYADIVVIEGPDSDPPVHRDVTYVLDAPAGRTYRLAFGSEWLVKHRPGFDYVLYLDDDSFVDLLALLLRVQQEASPSLALGFLMQTQLDYTRAHVCEVCDPCEPCALDPFSRHFCSAHLPSATLGGCMFAMQRCLVTERASQDELPACARRHVQEMKHVGDYFGMQEAPRWLLGMGW
eukprot:4461671-Amphidinium_carterae.1